MRFLERTVLRCCMAVLALAATGAFAASGEPKDAFFKTQDGVKIHYITLGDKGSWVVLVHGYTDTAKRMFFTTGIAPALAKNHRVVAFDHRNHGESDKPAPGQMGRPEDAIELMDHLKIDKAHIYGYSMGGGFVGTLLAKQPQRFITAIFGGSGIWEYQQEQHDRAVAWDKALAASSAQPSAARGGAPGGGAQGGGPPGGRALPAPEAPPSAEETSPFTPVAAARPHSRTPIDLSKVDIPVMSINGSRDTPFVKTQRMFRELRDFTNVILQDHDHMSAIAVSGPMPQQHVDGLVRFIDGHDLPKK
jgi:pimeloyl-ACP methyl ester carboxylesterase